MIACSGLVAHLAVFNKAGASVLAACTVAWPLGYAIISKALMHGSTVPSAMLLSPITAQDAAVNPPIHSERKYLGQ